MHTRAHMRTHAHTTLIELAMQFHHFVLLPRETVDPLNVQSVPVNYLNTTNHKDRERVAFCGDVGQVRAKVTLLLRGCFGLLGAFSSKGQGDARRGGVVCVVNIQVWCVRVCVRVCVVCASMCMISSLLHRTLHSLLLLPLFFLPPLFLLPLLFLLFHSLLSLHLLCCSLH